MNIKETALQLLKIFLGSCKDDDLSMAIGLAKDLAHTNLSNHDKQTELRKRLKSNLPEVRNYIINLLAELAVSMINRDREGLTDSMG